MSLYKVKNELGRLPWIPIIILGGFIFIAIFASWISPYGYDDFVLSDRLKPPSWGGEGNRYLLGTDNLGHDMLTQVIYGARVSLIVAISGLVFGGGLGLAVGIVAGYYGGTVDSVLMRLTDCFMALPTLLIALVFVMTVVPGLQTVIIALSIITWSRFSRVIRSEVLSLKECEFVAQAKVAGCSNMRIILTHIFPNVLNTFIVICTLQVSQLILTEATLSFLGAGVPPPTPTWGSMVANGKGYITSAWWISAFPGVALGLVVYSFNILGDWLRDWLDPKLREL